MKCRHAKTSSQLEVKEYFMSRSLDAVPPETFKLELTVGEVAARSGIAVSTLHFYETKGLIASWRNAGNQRRYARDVLRRVAIIKVAQRMGVPLADIHQALL